MSEGDFAKLLSAAVCRSGPPLDIRFWYGLPLLYIPPELMVRLGCGCGAAACTCPLLSAVSCTLLMLLFSDLTLAPSGAAELASSWGAVRTKSLAGVLAPPELLRFGRPCVLLLRGRGAAWAAQRLP